MDLFKILKLIKRTLSNGKLSIYLETTDNFEGWALLDTLSEIYNEWVSGSYLIY